MKCFLLVCNGWHKCFTWADLSISTNICSSNLGSAVKANFSEILIGNSLYRRLNLFGAFRCCCSICIERLLCNSFFKLLPSVKVSICPDSFHPSKTSNQVQRSIIIEGKIIFNLHIVEH